MDDHSHSHDEPRPLAAVNEMPVDAGSQALSEALRSSFVIVKFVMLVLVLVFLGSGFFTVGPQQRAIILRFGRPVGDGQKALLGPGLHWSFPYPIDEYVTVSISGLQQVRSTTGWYATTDAAEAAGTEVAPSPDSPMNPIQDGFVLTADNNIIHSRATLTYRIEDPIAFIFDFANASNAVQKALDDALLATASRFKVDDMLTHDLSGFSDAVQRRAVQLIEERHLGVVVEQCVAQSIAPRQIQTAFQSVTDAELARSKVLNEARSYEAQTLSKASADAESRINAAQSERARVVNEVAARASQFQELLPKFRANPKLFAQQRLQETLGRVLGGAQDKIFLPESGSSKEVRMLFNREPKIKGEETKP